MEGLNALADDLVPVLEKEYEAIMKELEKEQAEVAEIEACDQDYLNELKAEIAEQKYAYLYVIFCFDQFSLALK